MKSKTRADKTWKSENNKKKNNWCYSRKTVRFSWKCRTFRWQIWSVLYKTQSATKYCTHLLCFYFNFYSFKDTNNMTHRSEDLAKMCSTFLQSRIHPFHRVFLKLLKSFFGSMMATACSMIMFKVLQVSWVIAQKEN